jgi:hypothetical protein
MGGRARRGGAVLGDVVVRDERSCSATISMMMESDGCGGENESHPPVCAVKDGQA